MSSLLVRYMYLMYLVLSDMYTLPKKKRNFNFQIFHGDPGTGSATLGHAHQGKCSLEQQAKDPIEKYQTVLSVHSIIWVHIFPWLSWKSWNPGEPGTGSATPGHAHQGKCSLEQQAKDPIKKYQTVLSVHSIIWVHIFPWLSWKSWNPIAANANSVVLFNVAFLFGKNVYVSGTWGHFYCYNSPPMMGKRSHLKISNDLKMVTEILRPCLCKLLDFDNLIILPRWHVLKHFKIVRQPWGVFEWGLLHIVARRIRGNVVQPQIFRHTLFPKRKSPFNLAGGIQFREITAMTCTQMPSDCARTVRNFGMGFLTNCYQEQCTNEIWPKVHWPTLLPKRKATSEKLRFFWGRVYIVATHPRPVNFIVYG